MSQSRPARSAPERPIVVYLEALFGREPAGLIEVRFRRPRSQGMRQRFHAPRRLQRTAATLRLLARRNDVYVGVAPRTHRRGGLEAVERSWALWADCDGPAACEALAGFTPAPSMVVSSGGGPARRHAYWLLAEPLEAARTAVLNRRLAHALGADLQAADAARILRPPGTTNHKHGRARPVALELFTGELLDGEAVGRGLSDPPGRALGGRRDAHRSADTDDLLELAPDAYVRELLGVEPGRDGKVACPFHEDRTPSLHVYETPAQGWFCFGCSRGGSVYDLGSEVLGLDLRGDEFLELRRQLRERLLS